MKRESWEWTDEELLKKAKLVKALLQKEPWKQSLQDVRTATNISLKERGLPLIPLPFEEKK